MQPINFSDEAHATNAYIDPTDPAQRKLIGSTTVIKKALPPYLVPWAAKLTAEYAVDNIDSWSGLDRAGAVDLVKRAPDRARDSAGDKGTVVHRMLELAGTGKAIDEVYDASVAGYVSAGLRFLDDWQPEFIWNEATVFHPDLGYAGTLDFIARLPGLGLVIGDYKTSNGVYPEVAVQLASYRFASHAVARADDGSLARVPVPDVDGGVVVHIKGDGTYQLRPVGADRDAFETFTHCLAICDWKARKGVIAPAQPAPKNCDICGHPGPHEWVEEPDTGNADHYCPRCPDGACVAPENSGEVPAGASGGDEAEAPISVPKPGEHTSPDDKVAWLKRRITAIVTSTPDPARLTEYNVATAGDLMAAWWPEGVPTLREGGQSDAQLDAIAERASMVEKALGLPFPDPEPAVDADNVRIPADDPRVVELVERLRALPADLLAEVETNAAGAGITAKVSLGLPLGKLRTLDGIVAEAEADVVVRRQAVGELMAPLFDHPARFALWSYLHDVGLTAAGTEAFALMIEAAVLGYLTAVDPTNDPEVTEPGEGDVLAASLECESLLVKVHGNKRDALNHTKRAAKAHGTPAPKSFAEILGDPLLVALAISDPETAPATTTAA